MTMEDKINLREKKARKRDKTERKIVQHPDNNYELIFPRDEAT
jgi:hypothetical protein